MSHTQKEHPTHGLLRSIQAILTSASTSASRVWGAISKLAHLPATSIVLLIVLTIIDVALCLLAMYLIDLGISLMELWAELARKHLELTL